MKMGARASLIPWLCILLCASEFLRSFALESRHQMLVSHTETMQEGTNYAKIAGEERTDKKLMAYEKKVGGSRGGSGGGGTDRPKSDHKSDAAALLHTPCVYGFTLALLALRFLFV